MAEAVLEKVTAFIMRFTAAGPQLLLFEHPTASIQIPAGTMEVGEMPKTAVLREAQEETGLSGLTITRHLGTLDESPPPD